MRSSKTASLLISVHKLGGGGMIFSLLKLAIFVFAYRVKTWRLSTLLMSPGLFICIWY